MVNRVLGLYDWKYRILISARRVLGLYEQRVGVDFFKTNRSERLLEDRRGRLYDFFIVDKE